MTLEVLFAKAGQAQAFLLMLLCGAGSALLVQLTGRLHRVSRAAGLAGDALCALLVTLALGQTLLWTGSLRGYALLGMVLGVMMYLIGLSPLLRKRPR